MLVDYKTISYNYHRFLVPLFFEPYARDLINCVEGSPKFIVELACGTGILTRYLLNILSEESVLYATDVKSEMMAIAQSHIIDHRIHWKAANAHSLPFQDNSSELIICQFGVMFFQDKKKVFTEVNRILKPGGQFIFNTWDNIIYNDISYISQQVMQELYSLAAPDFSQKGPYSFYNSQQIIDLLTEAGFTQINISTQIKNSGLPIDDIVKGITEGSPLASYFSKNVIQTGSFKKRFKEKLKAHSASSYHQFKMQALEVIAKK